MSGPSTIEAGRDQGVAVAGRTARRRRAARVTNRSYGLSALNAADDVVAVAPGVRPRLVELVAVGVGVAGQVEPVPAPALAVMRATRAAGRRPSRRRPASRSPTNASISAGVGGRPVRSKVTRRMRCSRVAGGAGVRPAASSFARTKASIGSGPAAARGRPGPAGGPAASRPSGRPWGRPGRGKRLPVPRRVSGGAGASVVRSGRWWECSFQCPGFRGRSRRARLPS